MNTIRRLSALTAMMLAGAFGLPMVMLPTCILPIDAAAIAHLQSTVAGAVVGAGLYWAWAFHKGG